MAYLLGTIAGIVFSEAGLVTLALLIFVKGLGRKLVIAVVGAGITIGIGAMRNQRVAADLGLVPRSAEELFIRFLLISFTFVVIALIAFGIGALWRYLRARRLT